MTTRTGSLLALCICAIFATAQADAKSIRPSATPTANVVEPVEICPFEVLDRGLSPILVIKLDRGTKIVGEFADTTTEVQASFATFAVSVSNILAISRGDSTNDVCIQMTAGDRLTCKGGSVTVKTPMGTLTFPMTMIAQARASRVLFVDHSARGRCNGQSWTDAYRTLDAALSRALPGDEIWVAAGCYTPAAGSREHSISLKPDVALYGGFAGTEVRRSQRNRRHNPTVLSGDIGEPGNAADNSYRVVTGAKNAVLDGFTIVSGHASGNRQGGGLRIESAPMLVRNCVFKGNRAGDKGGAVHAKAAAVRFVNCVFDGNSAAGVGGAVNIDGGNPSFTGCVFARNTGRYGVMSILGGKPIFRNCTFALNHGLREGSIGTMHHSNVLMDSCLVWNNTVLRPSPHKPDLWVSHGSELTIANCFFARGFDDSVIRPKPGRVVLRGENLAGHPGLVNGEDPDGPDNIWGTADDGLRPANWSKCIGRGTSVERTWTDLAGLTLPAGLVSDIGAYSTPHQI